MRMFDENADSTILKIDVKYQMGEGGFSADMGTQYKECKDTESYKDCYKLIKSEFEGYKEANPSIHIKISGQLKGASFNDEFTSMDLFRTFLIENKLVDSKDLDDIDQHIEPCLIM